MIIPYYNKLFRAAGIRPEDIRTVDDLDKIPISKKTDVSDLWQKEVVASNMDMRKSSVIKTSGTSGVRLDVYRENKAVLTNLLHVYLWQLGVATKDIISI